MQKKFKNDKRLIEKNWNWTKIMKNAKNWKNGENGKIEMRPFGTLSEPPGSRKKYSEQLRSRSIGWWSQMMRSGTGKISKWSVCFWISGPVCQPIIVDPRFFFLSFSACEGSESENFVVKNQFSFQIWSKIVTSIFMNFHFHFSISSFRFCYIFAKFQFFRTFIFCFQSIKS